MPNVENEGWNPIYGACSSKCVFPMCVIWKRWCTRQRSGLCCPSCRENMMWKMAFSVWFASPFCSEMQGKAELRPQNLHQSYILHLILHLILHPKSSVNTTCLGHGCRKCRRFSKNFFRKGKGSAISMSDVSWLRKIYLVKSKKLCAL